MAQESRNQPSVGPKESMGLTPPERGARAKKGQGNQALCMVPKKKREIVQREHTARYGHFSGKGKPTEGLRGLSKIFEWSAPLANT